MSGAIACGLLGFIRPNRFFQVFPIQQLVLFAGMFVVGASMFYTGLAQKIGASIVKISGTGENSLMFGIMLVGAALSAVLSTLVLQLVCCRLYLVFVLQQRFPLPVN